MWIDPLGLSCKEINSSSPFGKYSTAIDDKVTVIDKDESLPDWVKESFTDSEYRTVKTNEDMYLYRVYGGNAQPGGAFVSTMPVDNKIQAKTDLALLPQWKNTRVEEAIIKVPKGTVLNIGKVAPQTNPASGTILQGGADQVLMPRDWPQEWIVGTNKVKP